MTGIYLPIYATGQSNIANRFRYAPPLPTIHAVYITAKGKNVLGVTTMKVKPHAQKERLNLPRMLFLEPVQESRDGWPAKK